MIKGSNIFLIAVMLSGCFQEKIKDSRELDNTMLDMQRMAMWYREYSFLVIKHRGKSEDSVTYYEHKMDSALAEYQYHLRRYNELVLEYKNEK